jgi:hypothetical protein
MKREETDYNEHRWAKVWLCLAQARAHVSSNSAPG